MALRLVLLLARLLDILLLRGITLRRRLVRILVSLRRCILRRVGRRG
jgi:NADH:ubiquinone oxidoreductase subunit K